MLDGASPPFRFNAWFGSAGSDSERGRQERDEVREEEEEEEETL